MKVQQIAVVFMAFMYGIKTDLIGWNRRTNTNGKHMSGRKSRRPVISNLAAFYAASMAQNHLQHGNPEKARKMLDNYNDSLQ